MHLMGLETAGGWHQTPHPPHCRHKHVRRVCLQIPLSTSSSILSHTSLGLWTEPPRWGGSAPPSRAGKMSLGVGGLEARASLTDKITGSAGTLADGRISFLASGGPVCPCLPPPDKSELAGLWTASLPSLGGVQVPSFHYMVFWQSKRLTYAGSLFTP